MIASMPDWRQDRLPSNHFPVFILADQENYL